MEKNIENVVKQLRSTLSKMDIALANIDDAIVWVDVGGNIRWCNFAFDKLVGRSHLETLGSKIAKCLPLELNGQQIEEQNYPSQTVLANKTKKRDVYTHRAQENENSLDISTSCFHFDEYEYCAILIIHDITNSLKTLDQVMESEERYELAASGCNDGLIDWDLNTGKTYYSEGWKIMLGFNDQEIGNSPDEWLNRVHPDDLSNLKNTYTNALKEKSKQLEVEYRINDSKDNYLWMRFRAVAVTNKRFPKGRIVGWQTNIGVQKAIEEQFRIDALHDKLTKLPNRTLIIDRLHNLIQRAKRHSEHKFAVLFIDVDRFKIVVDSLGHSTTDKLLVMLADRLKNVLRDGDSIGRFGGDEYVILLDSVLNESEVMMIVKRIQKSVSDSFHVDKQEIHITLSIGIAMNSTETENPEELLRDADNAMYRAKTKGHACHEFFDKEMHTHALDRLNLEADLRRAIVNKELAVYYQPIISLKTGKIVRSEALLRWFHPKRGLIPPVDFITLAEETGIIISLGEWVLTTALHQAKEWEEFGLQPTMVSVNFSSKQFHQPDLVKFVKNILNNVGVEKTTLEIEITENSAMQDIDNTTEILNGLKEIGVQLSIDDFGIGYSSLNYLKHFPLDCIKIDRSFIRNLHQNKDNLSITSAIIAMAHSLDLRVVAEGIETKEQLSILREKGCDEGQGFLFSKAISAKDTTHLLKVFKPIHI